ncbi:hypothetical protein Y032_0649g1121 [Ancylostoma ceylanicum]|uniref:Phosphoglycerate mutase family protein n=1 Tax=Ancylostoma ceylanicum TaxID=53326 RepID=A0A016WKS6_9BILA|nr:hypothetical protein Y032_0649g1121 [Ancylostoma ceylanicum]
MFAVSHGETVAEVFPQWLRLTYKGGGEVYQPYDLNMPATIPKRPAEHFRNDPPLTEHGNFTAEFTGKGIKLAGYNPYMIKNHGCEFYYEEAQRTWSNFFQAFRSFPIITFSEVLSKRLQLNFDHR